MFDLCADVLNFFFSHEKYNCQVGMYKGQKSYSHDDGCFIEGK